METKIRLIEELENNRKGVHLRGLTRLLATGLPNIVRYVKIFEEEKVIVKEKEANLVRVKLRESPKTTAYLKLVHTELFLKLPKKVQNAVCDFLNELEEKPVISLLFGSFAKGNYSKESDIDLLLVYQEVKYPKKIDNLSRRISMRTNTKINPIYVDYKNFEKNMLDKEHDFSREIRNKAIILSGIEFYYSIIWRFLK